MNQQNTLLFNEFKALNPFGKHIGKDYAGLYAERYKALLKIAYKTDCQSKLNRALTLLIDVVKSINTKLCLA